MLLMNENNKIVFADREKCMLRILKCCSVTSSSDPSGILSIGVGVQWLSSVMQLVLSSSSSVGNRKLPETKPLREKQAVDLIRSLIRSRVSLPVSRAPKRNCTQFVCNFFRLFTSSATTQKVIQLEIRVNFYREGKTLPFRSVSSCAVSGTDESEGTRTETFKIDISRRTLFWRGGKTDWDFKRCKARHFLVSPFFFRLLLNCTAKINRRDF